MRIRFQLQSLNKCNAYQEQFHRYVNSEEHNEMENWKIAIIDRNKNVLELRRRQSYTQHRLDTFTSNGLNERFVDNSML